MKNAFIRFLTFFGAPAAFVLCLSACVDNQQESISIVRAELASGNAGAAVVRLRRLLQHEPGYREARVLLGQILLDSGNPVGAERELRQALEIGADQETVKPLLARALVASGDGKRALTEFAGSQLRSSEAQTDMLVSLAHAHLLEGKIESARRLVQEAAERASSDARLAIVQAMLSAAENRHEAALSAINQVLAGQPNSLEALRAKANIALAGGDSAQAISALQTLALAMPSDVGAQYAASVLLWQTGQIAQARVQLERLRAVAPAHARTAHLDALVALHDKDLRAAREHVAQALKADPGFLPTVLLAANIHAELGEFERAENELNAVIGKEPDNIPARRALLALLLKTQRKERALSLAQDLLKRAPEQSAVLKLAAAAHLQAGDAKTSKALFAKALALAAPDAQVLMGLGLAHMAAGEREQGVNVLLQASAADESSASADLFLVRHYIASKQFDKGLQILAARAARHPPDGRFALLEGELLVAAGRKSEALAAFDRAITLGPEVVAALREVARLERAEGKPERVRQRFTEAIARRPNDVDLLLLYANWLDETPAERANVRATIEKAVAVAPDHVEARIALAAYYASRKDLDIALDVAEEAVKAIPGNARLLTALAELYLRAGKPEVAAMRQGEAVAVAPGAPELLVRLADFQLAGGAKDAAAASLHKALSLRSGFEPAIIRVVAMELEANRPEAALAAARDLQKSSPLAPMGYSLESKVLIQNNKWPEAVRVLQTGIERSQNPQLVIDAHRTLVRAGRQQEAAGVLVAWQQRRPKDFVVRSYLADSALGDKDYARALRLYKEIVRDFPDSFRTFNNLAWTARVLGDTRALDYAQQAWRLAPDDPAVLDTLGLLLVERGELARGIQVLRRATVIAPDLVDARRNLARALARSGDKSGAQRELEVVARLGKTDAELKDLQ